MEYDSVLKKQVLDSLENRLSSIALSIEKLSEQGYISSLENIDILNMTTMLIQAYNNIELFSKERQDELDIIYNKLLKL